MLLKTKDPDQTIPQLEGLLPRANKAERQKIEREIAQIRAGLKGEREAAYYIDFDYGRANRNVAVIHDLRLEHSGRVAQIDHLLIFRDMSFAVLETKHFASGLKITEEGEFLRWNDFAKKYEGMESPIDQCERHVRVLEAVLNDRGLMPVRLGMRMTPKMEFYVLVNPKATLMRPKLFDTRLVVKADHLRTRLNEEFGRRSHLDVLLHSVTQLVSADTVRQVANKLIAQHRPHIPDVGSKYGISAGVKATAGAPALPPKQAISPAALPLSAACKVCRGADLEIRYGRFGYYWKCRACGGNTALTLPGPGILRKDRDSFYFQPAEGGEALFFRNPPSIA